MQRFTGKSVFGPTGIMSPVSQSTEPSLVWAMILGCGWAVQENPVDVSVCV